MNEPITKREAEFFRDQCLGCNGENATNDTLQMMFIIYCKNSGPGVIWTSKYNFAGYLRQIADRLDEDET